jgi:Mrp family chromosome partitioning ATPase
VEADLRRPVLAERLGIAADGGLAEYLRGSDTRLSSRTLELPSGSLQVVLAGASNDGAGDVLASRRFAEALAQLTQEHDVVVVDGPPMIPVADALEIVPVVDAYVICLRAGRTKLAQLTAARALLERLPKRPGGAVITGVTKSLYRLDGADGYYRETAA